MGQGNSKCDGVHEKIRERVPAALLRGIKAPSGPSAPGHGSDEDAASGSLPGVPRETRVKLVLLGDTGVGKSAIVVRFVQGEFSNESKVTVGAAFLAKALRIPESPGVLAKAVKFEIWDTAGQERYASLAPLYYRGAGAAVVVYDITSTASFEKARFWVKELQKHASPNINMVLVGNKKDLETRRAVRREDARAFANENGMAMECEASALSGDGVIEIFKAVAMRTWR
jgi:Ras-related protein Rab-5B